MAARHPSKPILSVPAFLEWLRLSRANELVYGETVARLGVSSVAAWCWMHGKRVPSRAVRLRAAVLAQEARELDPGLPIAGKVRPGAKLGRKRP